MKMVPEKESAKKHGLENIHTNEDIKVQKTSTPPQSAQTNMPLKNEPAKKHGKEDIR
jgi:hypothetical protein